MKLIHVDEISELDPETLGQLRNSAPHEIDRSKIFAGGRTTGRNLELAYIKKLDEERAKSQHYYMTIKAMIHLLKSDANDEKKVDSMWKLMEEMGFC